MGQSRRRKKQLGDLYGTPEGRNRKLLVYQEPEQPKLDETALAKIRAAQADGLPVLLIGTQDARPLADAAGLPWLHELPQGAPIPRCLAWQPPVTEDDPMPLLNVSDKHFYGGLTILGAGSSAILESLNNDLLPLAPTRHN